MMMMPRNSSLTPRLATTGPTAPTRNSLRKTIAIVLAALAPMPIYRARTEGGWRWR